MSDDRDTSIPPPGSPPPHVGYDAAAFAELVAGHLLAPLDRRIEQLELAISGELEALRSEVSGLRQDASQALRGTSELRTRVDELERHVGALQSELEDVRRELAEARRRLDLGGGP